MPLTQWCSIRDNFDPQGSVAMSGDIFGYHCLEDGKEVESATGIFWVEARDAANHPTIQIAPPPTNKNYLAQNVNSV